jgi:hypothetical protein
MGVRAPELVFGAHHSGPRMVSTAASTPSAVRCEVASAVSEALEVHNTDLLDEHAA